MPIHCDYRALVGANAERVYKATLFQSPRLLLGLNCLQPGQRQETHLHADQDKFYFVLEGQGEFTVGEEALRAGPGLAVWAPAGVGHGVINTGVHRLVLLVGIAPAPDLKQVDFDVARQ